VVFLGAAISRQLSFNGKWIARADSRIVPKSPTTYNELLQLVEQLAKCRVCIGNNDMKFEQLNKTLFHENCSVILEISTPPHIMRCQYCSSYRSSLRKQLSRKLSYAQNSENRVLPHSRTPLQTLTNEEVLQRSRNLSIERQKHIREIQRLKLQIEKSMQSKLITTSHPDIDDVCNNVLATRLQNLKVDSFQRLFIEEQLKVNSGPKYGISWHPAIIRWCLLLHHKSKSSYRFMQQSGLNYPLNALYGNTVTTKTFHQALTGKICLTLEADFKIKMLEF
jgi:hypothetical protein